MEFLNKIIKLKIPNFKKFNFIIKYPSNLKMRKSILIIFFLVLLRETFESESEWDYKQEGQDWELGVCSNNTNQ